MPHKPTERRFEDHIEWRLNGLGYESHPYSEYDRARCLISGELVGFLQDSQPEAWENLHEVHGADTEHNVLKRIAQVIARDGVSDALGKPVADRGVQLDLCYFKPTSGMNPEHHKQFTRNRFALIRQLRYANNSEKSLDMVLFLNGIPLATLELKNQLTGQNVFDAQKQYKNDRDPCEPLFKFKRCAVHFCVDDNKVFMTTQLAGANTRFLPFNRDLENPAVENGYRTEYLWEEILTPDSMLDILENFVRLSGVTSYAFNAKTGEVDAKKSPVLVFPRYHQLDLIRQFRKQIVEDGVGTNYLVQHTTGSGKSYSIGWLAHILVSFYRSDKDNRKMFDTVVVVTDRIVLDDQLKTVIQDLSEVRDVVVSVGSGRELRNALERTAGIVITTIQKFPSISKNIAKMENKNFGVIIDEVHSSQSGKLSTELKRALAQTDKDDDDAFDYEEMMMREIKTRGKQKHISFFGFTGTPKNTTLEVFGTKTKDGTFEPFHIYSMHQSIYENFTLDVLKNYTTYKRYFKVLQTCEEKFVPKIRTNKEIIRYVDSDLQTIKQKADIILEHWIQHGSKEINGKSRGMIVTGSRENCVKYFHEVNRQLKDRGVDYRALVGFSDDVVLDGGDEKYSETQLNRDVGCTGNVPLGLKDPRFRLLIVAYKYQTGFDEPLVQSMYVDRKLEGIQCVQTLSRLNRTMKGKTRTFVLDFVNEPKDIHDAFQPFYQSTSLDGETDPNLLYDTLGKIKAFNLYTDEDVKRFCVIYLDPNRKDDASLNATLDQVVEQFKKIGDESKRADVRGEIQTYILMYDYLSQIITFADISLEESYVFLSHLIQKLPRRESDSLDLSDVVDLDSLSIKMTGSYVEELDSEDAEVKPPDFEPPTIAEPERNLLSEIINELNTRHGINLSSEDQFVLAEVRQEIFDDSDIAKYMKGNNSEEDKRDYFKGQFTNRLFELESEQMGLYKKIGENEFAKSMIEDIMYRDYHPPKE